MTVQELLSRLLSSVQLSPNVSWVPSALAGASQTLLSATRDQEACVLPYY